MDENVRARAVISGRVQGVAFRFETQYAAERIGVRGWVRNRPDGTVQALFEERGDEEKVWGSMVKQAIKRRKPGFNESYHGFRNFGQLLEQARDRNLLDLAFDEKSGGYIVRGFTAPE
jgi:acylphosphatase